MQSSVFVLLVKLIQVLLVTGLVRPKRGGLRVERALIVRLTQKRLYREEDRSDVVKSAPLLLQDVEADRAINIDVGMETFCQEVHRGRRIRIRVWEF